MRKLPIALGVPLILVCAIVASGYNWSTTNPEWTTEKEINEDWSISGNFNSGENITLFIAWSAVTYGEDFGELPTNVTITANNGDKTDFTVYFLGNPNSPPGQEPGRQQIYVGRIELASNDGDSLAVDDPPKQIGGIVKQAGTFEARVHPPTEFAWAGSPPQPPDALRLLKVVLNRIYPYRGFLPAGIAAGVLGAGIIIIWRDKPNRAAVRAKKRRAKSR